MYLKKMRGPLKTPAFYVGGSLSSGDVASSAVFGFMSGFFSARGIFAHETRMAITTAKTKMPKIRMLSNTWNMPWLQTKVYPVKTIHSSDNEK